MSTRLRLWLVVALAAVGLAAPTAALADGDPASDVLLTENVFLPYQPPVSSGLAGTLAATVARAHRAGYPVKVALIESTADLGADPELFGTPGRYARFLDTEITYNSTPPLLVVMPQGFGTAATVPASALSAVAIDRRAGSDGLARSAVMAVVALARRAGHPIAAPNLPAPASAGGGAPVGAIAGAAAVLLILAAIGAAVLITRRRRAAGTQLAR